MLSTLSFSLTRPIRNLFLACSGLLLFWGLIPHAEAAVNRISAQVTSSSRVALEGSLHPQAKAANQTGHLDGSTKLSGITMYFKPSASQQQDLDTLLAEQQDPTSANYHKWITPAEWATRFGMSDSDLEKVQAWLTSQGFTIEGISKSRNSISFSGTAAQAEAAFGTEIHTYTVNGSSYFAPSTELSIPSALSGVVLGVRNLNSFRPTPHRILKSNFTSSTSGNHYLAPDDITTIYDVKALYNAGYDGTGERIAVVGQSAISTTDVANFRSAAGLASKAPTLVLVPGTGSSVTSSGDETESDLDVEWSGAIAKNADVYFVYTGSNSNYSVFDALYYVVETNLAPVISVSYGTCEANLSTSDKTTLLSWFQQANSQGQTIVAAAGDSGAADCDYQATSASKGLAVDVPASYAEVTGIGGTTFSEGSGSYWNSSNNSYNGSALSYIPEVVWNDTSSAGELAAGGGGKSALFSKPSWQSATGVPSDGMRDVPDISLDASSYHDGYLYCSEDSSTGITGSCSNGFRDSNNTYLTVAGGTSFGAPIFSGILTLINQWKAPTGQGNINSTLYSLYSSAPSAFHDITSGNNKVPCTSGSTDCGSSGYIGYTAGTGYDQATGLGTIDAYELASSFPTASTSTLTATTTTVTASTTTLTSGVSVTFTATVAASSGSGTPTGTITWAVDGTSVSTSTLSSGTATYSTSFTQTGSHIITATYSGSTTYASSYGVVVASLGSTASTGSSGTGSGTSTVTVTSKNSYAGTVKFSLSSSSSGLSTACYSVSNAAVSANSTATSTITIYTTTSDCTTGSVRHAFGTTGQITTSSNRSGTSMPGRHPVGTAVGFAAVLLIGGLSRKTRSWTVLSCLLVAGALGVLSGCGSSSSSSSSSSSGSFTLSATNMTITRSSSSGVSAGTYTITVTGTDTSSSSLTATTTFTLTVN